MLRWIKEKYKLQYRYFQALRIAYTEREQIKAEKNKIAFIMLAANYDNLGDIAITKAQEEYLKRILPSDYEVIKIPHDKTFNVYLSMKKLINEYTIITLIGGGNSGTLYEFIEWPRRFILKHFSKCKIISFPQSVFYGNKKYDLKYKHEFVKLCKQCKNLTLIAREDTSYNKYKEMLGSNARVLLVPDIVFTLKEYSINNRKGACMIFRNDKEKSISSDIEEELSLYCKTKFGNVSYADTCDVHITGSGYTELKEFIDMIKSKELVVTDRLHGMILAYISGTPCIVLDNNNHKIKSTYDTWLQGDGKILLLRNSNDINYMLFKENRIVLDQYFNALNQAILEGI